jgi:hypothetical protein
MELELGAAPVTGAGLLIKSIQRESADALFPSNHPTV